MTDDTLTPVDRTEEQLSWAGLAVADTVRVAELGPPASARSAELRRG